MHETRGQNADGCGFERRGEGRRCADEEEPPPAAGRVDTVPPVTTRQGAREILSQFTGSSEGAIVYSFNLIVSYRKFLKMLVMSKNRKVEFGLDLE